jgi:hypothetical protein
MHIAIAVFIIFVVWHRGIWRDWKQYHATMLFFGFMDLAYNSICKENNYFLWRINLDVFSSRITLSGLYVFVIYPFTVLLFLNKLPRGINKQIIHVAKWVVIYTFVEWIGGIFNRIEYFNGWSLLHSFVFNIILFSGLMLHYKRPFTAYVIFLAVTIVGILMYKIPI